MGRNEPIPARIDENGDVVPLNVPEDTNMDYAAVKIFIAAVNAGHQLVYTNQKTPNSRDYADWETIDNHTYLYEIDCSTTKGGHVTIAAIDAETNTIQYFAENPEGTALSARWLPREDLGAPKGMKEFSVIRLAQDVNGMDCVLVSREAKKGREIWWKYRNPPVIVEKKVTITPPGATEPITVTVKESQPAKIPWSDWVNINGSIEGGFKTMYVANNADGRMVITGNLKDGSAYVRQQDFANPYDPEKWGDWTQPGGNNQGNDAQLAKPILDGQGRVSIFANFAGTLKRSRQTEPGSSSWEPWSIPGLFEENAGDYGLTVDGDGCIYLMALGIATAPAATKILSNREYSALEAAWIGWEWAGMVDNADYIELTYNADGTITAFLFDKNMSSLSLFDQIAINSSEWYAEPVKLDGSVQSFALTRDITP